jgi:hypothetical protein
MIEFLSGTPSWYSIDDLPPVFKVTEAKPTVNQWATGATASSQFSTGGWSASKATGQPDTGLTLGANGADNANAWAQATADKTKVNNITLTYASEVFIKSVTVRESFNAGTISKLEVDKYGTFRTVYKRNLDTDVEEGGHITGDDNRGRVSDTLITLTDSLNWRSNKIRITLGNDVEEFNEIDAVMLTSLPEARKTEVDYNHVINKPTSGAIHSVETIFDDFLGMDLQGNIPVEIQGLRTEITPRSRTSRLSISADVMCCAQLAHLYSLIIYVNGKPHRANTASEKYIDAIVPITKWTSDTSVLYSVVCNVKASHGNNTDKVTVTVMAYYHKDVDATELTASLFINKAKVSVKGVASVIVGSSTLTVSEID